jgi:two-component system sensor histidine kinase PhoQ
MIRLSLRLRSFAAALLALLFFIPLTAFTLQQAFSNSLSQAMLTQLRIQSFSLISEFEMQDGVAQMPEQLFNDPLNSPGSGLYAFIQKDGDLIWESISMLDWPVAPKIPSPDIGEERFDADFYMDSSYFLFAYTAEFETLEGYAPISFFIVQDKSSFNAERDTFANTLWYWLGLIAFLLLALLLFSLNTALSPINALIEKIKDAESGKISRISAQYPPELEKLKNSINHLLDTEKQQRSRYKNSLSDLAHSLKTPLAVLTGTEGLPRTTKEPLQQIDNIIQRQLKRAVFSNGGGWDKPEAILPVVKKLKGAMGKVYAEKRLNIDVLVDRECMFYGDKTDLMELLGNLIDNACKAAESNVCIRAQQKNLQLIIAIEDDGPGIPIEHRNDLLTRGMRLDSYREGQGIGMAVVADLLTAYQGQLAIDDSVLGGAKIQLIFTVPMTN